MERKTGISVAVFLTFLVLNLPAHATDSTVPEPFRAFDPNSTYVIKYADLDALYANAVTNMGRSTREKAAPIQAATGTRMKEKVNRSSVKEANRFSFEAFEDNDESRLLLTSIRDSLSQIPGEVPLAYFSRDEQLAYWINLYNITLLTELVAIYPQRNLKKFLTGKNSILPQKLLMVAGIPLSLDDIQFTILRQNYDDDPLIMYGLYQGIPRTGYSADGAPVASKITIFRGPLVRANRAPERLADAVAETVYHEIAHHFGIDDDRLHEIDRY